MAGVILEHVSRIYPGNVTAVEDVSFEVRDREFVVLVGPSGCGKSTTLRLIAGLEHATSGTIRIGDRVVNHVAPKDRDIAMVFQNYALYPHMSVYQNMAFGLKLRMGAHGWKRALCRVVWPGKAAELANRQGLIDQRIRDAARTLGIDGLLNRMPRQLSGGERQRVALGRAIVRQPAAFLFDEPLSNLDARLRVDMRRELKQLHQRLAATMVYVTHDQVEALTLGDRVVVMDRGVVQQIGAPLEVYERPANRFVAGFIGTPPMNLLHGELTREGENLVFRQGSWAVRIDKPTQSLVQQYVGRAVILGIRPEDVHLPEARRRAVAANGMQFANGLQFIGLRAVVRLVEPLGDSQIVHLSQVGDGESPAAVGETPLEGAPTVLSRTDPRARLTPGERVDVYFDVGRCHLFDTQTGVNVSRREVEEGN
jgi:multiple sugar transport system ATP-binding protein